MKKLTPKQRLFIHEYLVDWNGKQAAIRAGYSKKTAEVQACRLLRNAQVKKAAAAARERRENKAIMTREEILEELSIIGRSDLKSYFEIDEGGQITAKPFSEMPGKTSRALESIEETRTIRESADGKETNIVTDRIKFKVHSKVGALELLGKNQGLFPTKIDGKLEVEVRHSMDALKKSLKEIDDAAPAS